ncbi:DNA polymerase I [Neptunitalea chrysea]|uniref:DNA polymerase I n=1 Tax=Neptunitalea chrysea TaxID=1647581 RepID=A0A9W6B2G4_9FLAO|nr:DNA polymerase I [Neptunitalea chrysea]GLB50981.1 DNA polymerase I [Neptunitalea chrysea]
MAKKRLFLLDAYALIFRGYYAFIKNPRINSKGMDTSAVLGFMNSLLEVIKKEKPDHLAVCFDKGGSADRTEMFPEYKANRDETPEAIRIAVPIIQELIKAMNIPCIEKAGYEADDIIGTLAKKAEQQGYMTYMVTPDKDYAQLVSENIFMYRPARMGNGIEIWGIPEVQAKFGVERPEQVIDFLGMMGDSVDNIPGLPGVGEKTAMKFLNQFGSMEELLANTDQLKGKMKEKVEANAELGLLSKKLARIMLDVPVEFHEQDFEMCDPDFEKVNELFQELEFRRMAENLMKIFDKDKSLQTAAAEPASANGQTNLFAVADDNASTKTTVINSYITAETHPHLYQSVTSPVARKLLLEKLLLQKEVCFDTETTSLKSLEASLVGIAFSWEPGKGYYVVVPEDKEEAQAITEEFRPFFENEEITKIGQNLKYDIKVLSNYDINVKGSIFDTMIAHYLINPDMRHNMNVLAETYLNYQPIAIETLIGKKGKNQKSMRTVPVENQTEYAVEDADITLQLKETFAPELEEREANKLFEKVEAPLVKVLADMEIEGISVNKEYLGTLSEALKTDIAELEKSIFEQAGEEFNLSSPKQLGPILFDKLKLVDKPKKTKTGQYSTAEDVLSYLAKDHKIIEDILSWRSLNKLLNTYVDALPNEINPNTGKIHTVYSQAVAATGRLSSNNPNLQNIPIRTERGRQVRKAFIPRSEEYTILAADYSQIELRIIAALSEEENMISAFKHGEDIHAATAAKVFNVALEEVTREQRSNAKTVNFGIIYGVSAFGLSNQTSLNVTESKELIETYYGTYPKLKDYISKQVHFAEDHGYVETVLGRRRYLPDINSQNRTVKGAAERNAVNAPIQGSAADIIKLAMINIHKRLKEDNYKTKMLLQVHDELVFDTYKPELEKVQSMIKYEMENAYKLSVPLDVEIGMGNDWLEAH